MMHAFDAKNGNLLWQFPVSSGILAPPSTVQIDGKHLSGAKLYFNGSGVSAQSISVSADGEKLTAEVTVDSKAWLGDRHGSLYRIRRTAAR